MERMIISRPRPLTTGDQQPASLADARLAVLRALAYSDIFDYAPDRSTLYRALEYPGISLADFEQTLQQMQAEGIIIADGEHFMLAGRAALSATWRRRQHCSALKKRSARRYTALIRCLPFIRMVAITGTLAAESAEA